MSIAEEINDLQVNLQDAKDAVVEKGGTVGDTGLAGLAAEIADIPTGGGGGEIGAYGRLIYYWDVTSSYVVEMAEGCACTIVNQTTFGDFYDNTLPADMKMIQYENGTWYYEDMEAPEPMVEIPDVSAIGLSITFPDGDQGWAMIDFSKSSVINKASGTRQLDLTTANDYAQLSNNQGGYYVIGSTTIIVDSIKEFIFGASSTSVPDYFLNGAQNLDTIDGSRAVNVTSIGNTCFAPSIKSEVYFPNVTTMGSWVKFPNTVNLNMPLLTSIGQYCEIGGNVVNLPELTTIGQRCKITYATEVTLNKVQTVGNTFTAPNVQVFRMNAVQNIGEYFLEGSKQSTLKIDLGYYTLKTIGTGFLRNSEFTKLSDATGTNAYLTVPSTVTSIGGSFLYNCKNFCGEVRVNCPSSVMQGQAYNCLAAESTTQASGATLPTQVIGITLSGSAASDWKNAFPDLGTGYQVSSSNWRFRHYKV